MRVPRMFILRTAHTVPNDKYCTLTFKKRLRYTAHDYKPLKLVEQSTRFIKRKKRRNITEHCLFPKVNSQYLLPGTVLMNLKYDRRR